MKATPTPFDDKLIAQYLLGELPENKQVEIEDLAFRTSNICRAYWLSKVT